MDSFEQEMLLVFVSESRDMLDEIEPSLIELGTHLNGDGLANEDIVNSIFRVFHSLKGGAGSLEFENIARITHEAETLLDNFRHGKSVSESHIELLCKSLDIVRALFDIVEDTGVDEGMDNEINDTVAKLQNEIAILEGKAPAPAETQAPKPAAPAVKSVPEPQDSMSIKITKEMIDGFVQEANDLLEQAEAELMLIDDNPDDKDSFNDLFRAVHSFKGSCGFMGFSGLEKLSHRFEAILDLSRQNKIVLGAPQIQLLLIVIDVLKEGVEQVANEEDVDQSKMEAMIKRLEDVVPDIKSEEPAVASAPEPQEQEESFPEEASKKDDSCPNFNPETTHTCPSPEKDHILVVDDEDGMREFVQVILEREGFGVSSASSAKEALEIVSSCGKCSPVKAIVTDISMPEMDGVQFVKNLRQETGLYDMPVIAITAYSSEEVMKMLLNSGVHAYLEKPFEPADLIASVKNAIGQIQKVKERTMEESFSMGKSRTNKAKAKSLNSGKGSLRVDLSKLDSLINLVGELVIAEAMVTKNPDLLGYDLENFERASRHLNKIVRELQDVAMGIRMIPVANTFRKMIRLVHDLARNLGKEVNLELIGEDTEIDKTVVELTSDPLVHIIRNAVDHGIESPEDRIKKGKEPVGQITLEARHEGGEVWILVRDDGKGLHRGPILEKAIERGLVEGTGEDLTDEEVYRFVFHPGFSTAAQVTDVSGRGVGMDVVKQNIEKLNGRLDIKSVPDQGTTLILRIPLTLAILEGMMVRVGSIRYTLPILSIRESFCVEPEDITVTMDGQEIVKVRGELIPVIRLHALHNLTPDSENLQDGILIIVEDQQQVVAVFADEILGQHQAVIKGLSDYIGNVKSVMGCTILGDGKISLILDIGGIVSNCVKDTALKNKQLEMGKNL